MKSAIFLALFGALITSAVPVVAQERIDPTAGPIHRAMTREAARLAASREPTMSGAEAVQQSGTPGPSDWSRVRQLAPRTGLIVKAKGTPQGRRSFVAGDESELTVLNGAGQVEHIARTDVTEVSVLTKHIGRHVMWGALVGGLVGAALGWVSTTDCRTTYASDQHLCEGQAVGTAIGGAILGMGPGVLVGLMVGAGDPGSPDVIYRAP